MKTLANISVSIILFLGLSFSVQATTVVDLEWKTKSETNNDFFTLERSTDGKNWEAIVVVDGNGTTSTEHTYSFTDENAPEGIVYYSLRQTDYDGTSVQSKVISVTNTTNEQTISVVVYPNPTASFVTIASDQKVTVTGVLASNSSQVLNNTSQVGNVIDVQNLEAVMYYILYTSADGQTHTAPFVKR